MKRCAFFLLVLASVLLVASCGGGSDTEEDPLVVLAEFCELDDYDCLSDFFLSPQTLCDGDDTCLQGIVEAQEHVPLDMACDVHESECLAFINDTIGALRPTPQPLDPGAIDTAMAVLLSDPTVGAIIGDGERNVDYWLRLSPTIDPGHGDTFGDLFAMELILAEPFSWEGTVNRSSQPCKGHGSEGNVDPEDPCLLVEREFDTEFRSYSEVRVISGAVYVRQGLVANVFGSTPYADIIEDSIEGILKYPSGTLR